MVILGLGLQLSYAVSVRMPPLKSKSLNSYVDTYFQEAFNVKTGLFSICTEPWWGGNVIKAKSSDCLWTLDFFSWYLGRQASNLCSSPAEIRNHKNT